MPSRHPTPITLAAFALLFLSVGCHSTGTSTHATSTEIVDEKRSAKSGSAAVLGDPHVDVVRNGMLARFDSTTVGKALEGTFQNPRWSSFQTAKGVTVVQFDGTVKPDVLKEAGFNASTLVTKLVADERKRCFAESGQQEAQSDSPSAIDQARVAAENDAKIAPCMAQVMERLAIPVRLQFTLSADRRSFEIGYIDMEPFYTAADPYSRHGFERNPEAVLAFIYR